MDTIGKHGARIYNGRGYGFGTCKKINGFFNMLYGNDVQMIDNGCFWSIFLGKNKTFTISFTCFNSNRQYTFDGAEAAIEGQFS